MTDNVREVVLAAGDSVARDYVLRGAADLSVALLGNDLVLPDDLPSGARVVLAGFTETPERLRSALDLAFSAAPSGDEVWIGSVTAPQVTDVTAWQGVFSGYGVAAADDLAQGVRVVRSGSSSSDVGTLLLGLVVGMASARPQPLAPVVRAAAPRAGAAPVTPQAKTPAPAAPAAPASTPARRRRLSPMSTRVVLVLVAVAACALGVVMAHAFERDFFAVVATVIALAVVGLVVRLEQRGRRFDARVVSLEKSAAVQSAKLDGFVDRLRPRVLNRTIQDIKSDVSNVQSALGVNRLELADLHRVLRQIETDMAAREAATTAGGAR